MNWSEVTMVMFSCVAVNHLGLIAAIERTLRHSLPIVNCPKCLTFWTVLACGILSGENAVSTIAAALLFAYLATWLELIMGIIDRFYDKAYDTFYSTADNAADDTAGADSAMPVLREESDGDDSA